MGQSIITLTEEAIETGRSSLGGWSRAQLEHIGVPWPPPRRWKRMLIGKAVAPEAYKAFIRLKDKHL